LTQSGCQFKRGLAGCGRVQQAQVQVVAELVFKSIHGMEDIQVLSQLGQECLDLVNHHGLVADQQHT
jgi:hypothetical protein